MRESFVLKYRGNLSLQEQAIMTAEERRFFLEELEREQDRENKAMKKAQGGDGPKHIPGTIPD
jgi:hypothetical protein